MLRLWTMPGNECLIVVISSMQYHTSCSHLTFMWLDISYPPRNTPLTSASKRTLRTATFSVASWTGAIGGPGSRISHSAWLFKTAQDQGGPVMPSALIASVGRNCKNTFTTQEKFLNWWYISHFTSLSVAQPENATSNTNAGDTLWTPSERPM